MTAQPPGLGWRPFAKAHIQGCRTSLPFGPLKSLLANPEVAGVTRMSASQVDRKALSRLVQADPEKPAPVSPSRRLKIAFGEAMDARAVCSQLLRLIEMFDTERGIMKIEPVMVIGPTTSLMTSGL